MLKFSRLLPRYDQGSDMQTATNSINDAKNVGNNAISSYDPTQAGGASTTAVTGNFNTAQGQNKLAVDPLTTTLKSNPTVTDLYQQGNNLYNVPQLASTATNLSNEVTNAIPAGYGGARGFDIGTEAINNGVASKLSYLLPQSNAATANFNTASGLASSFVNAGVQQNAQNFIPAQTNAELTAANQAAEATGWNQAQKSVLDGLLAKMQSGVQLSTAEMATAQQLAATEEAYNAAVQQAQATEYAAQQNNKNVALANPYGSATYLNTITGKAYNPFGGLASSMLK